MNKLTIEEIAKIRANPRHDWQADEPPAWVGMPTSKNDRVIAALLRGLLGILEAPERFR